MRSPSPEDQVKSQEIPCEGQGKRLRVKSPFDNGQVEKASSPQKYDAQAKIPQVSPYHGESDYDGERSASASPTPQRTQEVNPLPTPQRAGTTLRNIQELNPHYPPSTEAQPVRQSLLLVKDTLRGQASQAIHDCDADLARLRKNRDRNYALYRKCRDDIDARIMQVEQRKLRLQKLGSVADELEALCQDPVLLNADWELTEKDSDGSEVHISEADTIVL